MVSKNNYKTTQGKTISNNPFLLSKTIFCGKQLYVLNSFESKGPLPMKTSAYQISWLSKE